MRSKIIRIAIVSGALCIVGAFMPALSLAGPILFDQTLVNSSAVVNTHVDMLDNCLAAEGCLGFGSTSPVPDVFAPIAFFLTPAQVAAITTTPVIGRFTIVASRDIGHKAGDPAVDFLAIRGDGGVALGNLFENTIDSCPPGERGTNYPATVVCGPNFHTDVQATDTLLISQANIQSFASDGAITFTIDPSGTGAGTGAVGRLKMFSFQLQIEGATDLTTVPEPSSIALIVSGLLLLPLARRLF